MRDYGKVAGTFWTGETGRQIRAAGGDAQRVALYLMTCPMSSMIGLYYLPIPMIAHEVGLSIEGATKALASLSEAQFAYWDDQTETVWVPEMASYQVGEPLDRKDKRVKGIAKEWSAMRKCKFYHDFYRRYKDSFLLPEPSPIEAPCKPLASQEQEQEQEQEREKAAPSAKIPDKLATERFTAAWNDFLTHLKHKSGQQPSQQWQETNLANCLRKGEAKAVADLRFSIEKNANNILDNSSRYAPPAATRASQEREMPSAAAVKAQQRRDADAELARRRAAQEQPHAATT